MTIEFLKSEANRLRAQILNTDKEVELLKRQVMGSTAIERPENKSEAIANAILAYRHLEDARMRLGKCIQALDGGVSVYDKPPA